MENSCDICKVVAEVEYELIGGKYWTVRLARDQGYVGRSYVTLKAHKGTLSELSKEEWSEFDDLVRRLEKAATDAYQSPVQNWACMMNNAFKVEPASPHVHWHFRPRIKQDITIAGTTFSDPLFGSHYDREQRNYVDDEVLQQIFNHLKKHIN